ncbi:MAG: cell division protein FtsZ, partial [Arcobacteraceae bacterium]
VILKPGSDDINVDFADVKTIMQHKGIALMGIGKAIGDNAATRALELAIKSPLLDEISLSNAKGIMIHWTVNPYVSMFAIGDVMENIHDTLIGNPDIIFGTTTDENQAIDEIKITIVATGFDTQEEDIEDNTLKTNKSKTNHLNMRITDDEHYYDTPPLMRGYSIRFGF